MEVMTNCIDAEEYNRLSTSENYADRLKAASIAKAAEGDMELSDTLNLLSAQLEFGEADDDTVAETRQKLHEMIQQRLPYETMSYHDLMTDEEVRALSGGEVTNEEHIDWIKVQYTRGGLYDPAIFGGSGAVPEVNRTYSKLLDKEGHVVSPSAFFSYRFGHIELPVYVCPDKFIGDVATILHMSQDVIRSIARFQTWIDFEDGDGGDLMPLDEVMKKYTSFDQMPPSLLSGGNAIRVMLENMHLPDHPERMTFKVLPVIPTICRITAFNPDSMKFIPSPCAQMYETIMKRAKRAARMMAMQVPTVIIATEFRMLTEKIDELNELLRQMSLKNLQMSNRDKKVSVAIYIGGRGKVIGFKNTPLGNNTDIVPYYHFPKTIRSRSEDGNVRDVDFLDVLASIEHDVEEDEAAHECAWESPLYSELTALRSDAMEMEVEVEETKDGHFRYRLDN